MDEDEDEDDEYGGSTTDEEDEEDRRGPNLVSRLYSSMKFQLYTLASARATGQPSNPSSHASEG